MTQSENLMNLKSNHLKKKKSKKSNNIFYWCAFIKQAYTHNLILWVIKYSVKLLHIVSPTYIPANRGLMWSKQTIRTKPYRPTLTSFYGLYLNDNTSSQSSCSYVSGSKLSWKHSILPMITIISILNFIAALTVYINIISVVSHKQNYKWCQLYFI